jgi:5'-nucleotidase (lipoprotein e(P4) family)
MKRQNSIFIFFVIIIAISCIKTAEKTKSSGRNEYLTQSVLWYQHSGEMKALYYQAYNTAKIMLDLYLKDSKSKIKKAVIVDIDETILNNVTYEAWLILSDSQQTKYNWKHWVDTALADTLPGALEFLRYAKSKDVEVFYVSNRSTADVNSSLKNLRKFNFPNADDQHMLFKTEKVSSKEPRRKSIAKDYEIILLCGDNLGDFAAAFDDRTGNKLTDSINTYKSLFGKKFILLPNPMYGGWERQIYGEGDFTDGQRDSIRKSSLKSY